MVGRYDEMPEPQYLVSFFTRNGTQSENFITNPAIRQSIESTGMLGQRIGGITFTFSGKKVAIMQYYFPLGGNTMEAATRVKEFRGKGIAQLLEYHALRLLREDNPSVEFVQFSNHMKEPHRNQMKKRGHRQLENERIPIGEFIHRLRWKIARDTFWHRSNENLSAGRKERNQFREWQKTILRRIRARRKAA
jgi:predicted GNAT family acetyltransferase